METKWSTTRHGTSVVVSNDQRTVTNLAQKTEVAVGENFYNTGTHVYRIKIGACFYLGIGNYFFSVENLN